MNLWLVRIETIKPFSSKGVWTRAFKHHTPICLRVLFEDLELQTVCDQTDLYIIKPMQKKKKKSRLMSVETDYCRAVDPSCVSETHQFPRSTSFN